MIETAKYRITGLVDYTDETGNIVGQLPVGSIQELPVEVGMKAVAEGQAEAVSDEEANAEVAVDTAETASVEEAPVEETVETEEVPADNTSEEVESANVDDENKNDAVE